MIRTVLALEDKLLRGALASLLAGHGDISVVAEVDGVAELGPTIRTVRPSVAVTHLDLYDNGRYVEPADPAQRCATLVLVDPGRPWQPGDAVGSARERVGFLGHHTSPQRMVEAIRSLADGQPVVDAELVVAALNRDNPLTVREAEVLRVAAEGCPVVEIAQRLSLAPGTVRNHLSRIAGKIGARTRIESVRIARLSSWI